MPHQFIDQLQEGALVQQFFLLRQVESRTDKTGKPYLSLVLGDKSGTMVGRVWSKILAKCPGPFAPGDYVGVQGQVDAYRGEIQLTVNYLNTVQALEALGKDLQDFDPELLLRPRPMTASNFGGAAPTGRGATSSRPFPSWSCACWTATRTCSWSAPRPASIITLTWAACWSTPGSWPATPWPH